MENILFEKNGNENENDCAELLRGQYYPIPYPTPRLPPTIFNHNDTDIELFENFILEYENDNVCDIINKLSNRFEYGFIANFYNIGYYYRSRYSPPTAIFNGIDKVISGNDKSQCIFGMFIFISF